MVDSPTQQANFWCSLDVVYAGRYALCAQECPLLARQLIADTDVGQVHTSCLPISNQSVSLAPDQSQIVEIVAMHNSERAATNRASDLVAFVWDWRVARIAQHKADTCQLLHDCFNCRKLLNNKTVSVGQNAYSSFNMAGLVWSWSLKFR